MTDDENPILVNTDTNDYLGKLYERHVGVLLRESGYVVEMTPASRDDGADVLAYLPHRHIYPAYVVQCKAVNRPVGVDAVQEVATAKMAYKSERALLITTNGVTDAAQQLGDWPWISASRYQPPRNRAEGLKIIEALPELLRRRAWIALECPWPLEQIDWAHWRQMASALYDGIVAGWPVTTGGWTVEELSRQARAMPTPTVFLVGVGTPTGAVSPASPNITDLVGLKLDTTASFVFIWCVPPAATLPTWINDRLDGRIVQDSLPESWFRQLVPKTPSKPSGWATEEDHEFAKLLGRGLLLAMVVIGIVVVALIASRG
ncbi:MAG: restriction endonuclease [Sulfobacillus sp.]